MSRKRKSKREPKKNKRRKPAGKQPSKAVQEIYQRALSIHQAGDLAQAENLYEQILKHHPKHPDALHFLGLVRYQTGDVNAALELMEQAIQINGDNSIYYGNRGVVYRSAGNLHQSRSDLETALKLNPQFLDAWNNLGATLKDLGELNEAAACCRKAIALQPDSAAAHNNLGAVLQDAGDFDGAVAAFEKTLSLNPDHPDTLRSLVFQYKKTCSWKKFEELWNRMGEGAVQDATGVHRPAHDPFAALSATDDPAVHFKIAENWARFQRRTALSAKHVFSFESRRPNNKITIGYLSSDFREHPVAYLTSRMFSLHDRGRFRVHAYSIGKNDGGPHRRKIEADCDRFADLFGVSDAEAATRIYKDGVDILVDLNGYTRGGRPVICALKPAPVQVNWLGFPGTLGGGFMDYIIADRYVVPPEQEPFFAEKPVYMPDAFMITDDCQPVSGSALSRAGFGLPENAIVYATFNAAYKMEPVMFRTWMQILDQVPESVLWLAQMSDQARNNLKHEAEKAGIDPDRLIFSKKVQARADHLARIRLADLVLDTRIYNGHASTVDALWAGVPVLTAPGRHFASRVSASLLTALGMPELIVRDPAHYERVAVDLGRNPQAVRALKEKLAEQRSKSPLFDTSRFVRSIEDAYTEMYRRYHTNAPAGRIELKGAPEPQHDTLEELHKALALHQAGQLDAAGRAYRDILAAEPGNADALHLSGVLAYQRGDSKSAIPLIRKAIAANPAAGSFYCNLGLALKHSGCLEESIDAFNQSLSLDPAKADVHNNLGTAYKQAGRPEAALECFKAACRLKPDYFEAWRNAGNMLKGMERFEESAECYENALKLNPEHEKVKKSLVVALNNIGVDLQQKKQYDEAIACFEKILALRPETAEAYGNLGNVYKDLGKTDQTLLYYSKALELKPDLILIYDNMGTVYRLRGRPDLAEQYHREVLNRDPDSTSGYNNLGIALQDQGQYENAIACFQNALDINPDDVYAHNNMGNVYYLMGRFDAAETYLKKAAELDPEYTEALSNLGIVYQFSGRIEQSIECYRKVLDRDPDAEDAFRSLVHQLQYSCAWDEVARLAPELDRRTDALIASGRKCAESPFENLSRHDDPARNFAVAKSWADNMIAADAAPPFDFSGRNTEKDRIRIGYLSVDFRNHAVAHLIQGMIGLHDRRRFEILCFSYGKNDNSPYRKRFETDADQFIDIARMSHKNGAEAIYNEQVDILVDLTGHTGNNRMGICAFKPAPVQANWLGFPGTSGADYMDYIITDRIVTPEDQSEWYSEEFVFMPNCYMITDNEQPISERTFTRTEFGLPDGAMVFCSFNGAYKIEPVMFDVWMKILARVPGSVLWLSSPCAAATRNICKEAEKRGVSPDRLVFSKKMKSKADHLARIRSADLILDTRLYNGHASTVDALWTGVPVLTRQGKHFASRVASSLLTSAGLPDLIVRDLNEYETLAVKLGKDPQTLAEIKERLSRRREICSLFDTRKFVRSLESAYEIMWNQYARGGPPELIDAPKTAPGEHPSN